MAAMCWAIEGQWPYFEVEYAPGAAYDFQSTPNAAEVNGAYATKAEALEYLIASLENTRRELSRQIAKHKAALRYVSRRDKPA